ncbi:hypothetical protein SELMODRAFT_446795 [Selaginella moellendorffii]|uniref:BAR domain-containing protein n=1 Tax=Selaginella moellendorffii TaxID=88036 RepID=D8SUE4_SELML|nr:uncharacterized protein At2g33490 [Selaginella moellendorffii]EFJ12059.1 hypothetical protein SELMODRAFT_446795 [Selaginella moellendorffii]|eukprot:XP_002986977.1 uncharacterized protein At2g33490 [Selaginella moellendorffii]
MKSWKKIKELARFKEKSSPAAALEPTQDIEEITRGMQDVCYMKNQYEGLHAVSSRVAGRAYGFSEAIQEMAAFLVESFALDNNGDINTAFKEVSKTQSELSRLLHLYAFHVSETLKVPAEGLLSELGHIEETKKEYDEKRILFDHMRLRKSRAKNVKAEAQIEQQLQESKEQFDELAMFLGCRLHSLEQSRPRHLLTQAARHHSAQMHLFRQGLGCLDDADPCISRIVQERNLDTSLDYLDGGENDAFFKTKDATEESDQSSSLEQEETSPKHCSIAYETHTGSRSAPLSPVRFAEANGVNSIHEVMLDGVSNKKAPIFSRTNSWLRRKGSRDPGVLHLYRPTQTSSSAPNTQEHSTAPPMYSVTEPTGSPSPSWIPSPDLSKARRPSPPQQQQHKKLSTFPSFPRRFQSGPLASTASSKPRRLIPSSGPLTQPPPPCVTLPVDPLYKSGPLTPTPKMSPTVSPTAASPPRVSELHKLPPPPLASSTLSPSPAPCTKLAAGSVSYSAPLSRPPQIQIHQQQQQQGTQHQSLSAAVHHHHHHHHHHHSSQASPLPPPPLAQAPSPASKSHNKCVRKNERVSPLPL